MFQRISCPIVLLAAFGGAALHGQGAPIVFDAEQLRASGTVALSSSWRFHPDDDASFARPRLDDSGWLAVETPLRRGRLPAGWNGIGWFRTRFEVAADLVHVPLALGVRQAGASEIYLDGELLTSYGTVDPDPAEASAATPLVSWIFQLDEAGEHVIAVRYANPEARDFQRVGWFAGFTVTLALANRAVPGESEIARLQSAYVWLFTGIFLSFALLHVLLFAFYPEIRENLYFALLCVSSATLVFLLIWKSLVSDPRFVLLSEPAMNVAGLWWGLFALRFLYGIFSDRLPRQYFVVLAVVAVLSVWAWLRPADSLRWVFLTMLAASLEMIRAVVVALWQRKPGAVLVGLGVLALGVGFTLGLLSNLGVLPRSTTLATLVPFFSMVALAVSMSVYLSHRFAMTSRELRRKLVEVEELSEQKLREERRSRRRELEKKLLEAEYERKVQELEEARELQLSMLPKRLPEIPELEIAAFMATATEVGGDYYDFHLADDGTLTIAIGDATGHGMRAGTMVTATKSLFNVLAQESDLLDTLNRSAMALKRMNLRKLAMALTLVQYRDRALRLAAAGMPPAFIYRRATGEVESVLLAGMPLGSFAGFPYRKEELRLEPGDAVLLMSDGFPERLNGDDEMLGYERTVESFASVALEPAQEIVDRLVAIGEEWAGGREADDDVTFIALKVRAPESA